MWGCRPACWCWPSRCPCSERCGCARRCGDSFMPACSIDLSELRGGKPPSAEQAQAWCRRLEAGEVLYFPHTPIPVPEEDLKFLLGQRQTGSALHKNIAYKPVRDQLSGVDEKSTEVDELRAVM